MFRRLCHTRSYGQIQNSVRCRQRSNARRLSTRSNQEYFYRHIGIQPYQYQSMLSSMGVSSIDELMDKTVPEIIRLRERLNLPEPLNESDALSEFEGIMSENVINKSYIGQGFYNTITPNVILRNMLQNPSWYTPYTPYQPEISQGRLEMMLNFQTMVSDLTGTLVSNASLLDEATSAAEAVSMAFSLSKKRNTVLVSDQCHTQNISVIRTRAEPLGIDVRVVPDSQLISSLNPDVFATIVQYPNTNGHIVDFEELAQATHECGAVVIAATDLLACTMATPPGEWGADIVVGTAQRFGVPMGFGGPNAGFLACTDDEKKTVWKMPGRIIGVSEDARGKPAYRMAIQAREQFIKRERATSNICTAQALLANISAAYGIWHGADGLREIAQRTNLEARALADGLTRMDYSLGSQFFFDTVDVIVPDADEVLQAGYRAGMNFRKAANNRVTISLDETTKTEDVFDILSVFSTLSGKNVEVDRAALSPSIPSGLQRTSDYLTHPIFSDDHSETAMMRYLYTLEKKDLGLNTAMVPLGSCTMKLNSSTVMTPVTWPTVNSIHPFAPSDQTQGYAKMLTQMEDWLATVTGFDAVSLQPNSGAQGEYAGLMCIRAYHLSRGDTNRNVCLIPVSAHGTNPASAAAAGMKIVVVKCNDNGDVDLDDLRKLAEKHSDDLAATMITYPSTHGVFENGIRELCEIIHSNGGLVYMDGANLQAQVGFCSPGNIGADVCHLNLHKTFCIPHGGGGPGMGPIGVNKKLAPFLPRHPALGNEDGVGVGAVCSAPFSSASILPIPWMYIRMMGHDGLKEATQVSIMSANYMRKKLENDYDILYTGDNGFCAHEFIIDLRKFSKVGLSSGDVAKRLMDFGFHAPTVSWPVVDTLMVEPTESEPLSELDRFCDAMIAIRKEITDVETGQIEVDDSPLKHCPHTVDTVAADEWTRPYSRTQGAFPLPYLQSKSFWPSVGRIDSAKGDRNLVCTCPPLSMYE